MGEAIILTLGGWTKPKPSMATKRHDQSPQGMCRSPGHLFFVRFHAFSWPINFVALAGLLVAGVASAERIEISWPTPNRAWEQGRSYESWVQPTVSGDRKSVV